MSEETKYCRVPYSVLDGIWELDPEEEELGAVLRIIQALYTEGEELSIERIAQETNLHEVSVVRLSYIVKGLESMNGK